MTPTDENKPISIRVLEEQATVDKAIVEKGNVRIVKKVYSEDENVDVELKSEEVKVEKVTINQYVDTVPAVRQEGNTTIIPIVKEVAVVEKKILLVEEIYVTKTVVTSAETKAIPLRKEEVIVEKSSNKSID